MGALGPLGPPRVWGIHPLSQTTRSSNTSHNGCTFEERPYCDTCTCACGELPLPRDGYAPWQRHETRDGNQLECCDRCHNHWGTAHLSDEPCSGCRGPLTLQFLEKGRLYCHHCKYTNADQLEWKGAEWGDEVEGTGPFGGALSTEAGTEGAAGDEREPLGFEPAELSLSVGDHVRTFGLVVNTSFNGCTGVITAPATGTWRVRLFKRRWLHGEDRQFIYVPVDNLRLIGAPGAGYGDKVELDEFPMGLI